MTIAVFILSLMLSATESLADKPLDLEQDRMVRSIIGKGLPPILFPTQDRGDEIGVPTKLKDCYSANRLGTLDLLLKVAEGANPLESTTALSYAFSLTDNPVTAVASVLLFDEEMFDKYDKYWETSPRKHWINKLREKLKNNK